jgi:hypothetical protein
VKANQGLNNCRVCRQSGEVRSTLILTRHYRLKSPTSPTNQLRLIQKSSLNYESKERLCGLSELIAESVIIAEHYDDENSTGLAVMAYFFFFS